MVQKNKIASLLVLSMLAANGSASLAKRAYSSYENEQKKNPDVEVEVETSASENAGYITDWAFIKTAESDATVRDALLKQADGGDANAMVKLASVYYHGKGFERDFAEAFRWNRTAAFKGNAIAQNNLGYLYDEGRGTKKDPVEAYKWYKTSAGFGCAAAQCNLGLLIELGRGTAKNLPEALSWYQKAADQGNAAAKRNLFAFEYEERQNAGKTNVPISANVPSGKPAAAAGNATTSAATVAAKTAKVPFSAKSPDSTAVKSAVVAKAPAVVEKKDEPVVVVVVVKDDGLTAGSPRLTELLRKMSGASATGSAATSESTKKVADSAPSDLTPLPTNARNVSVDKESDGKSSAGSSLTGAKAEAKTETKSETSKIAAKAEAAKAESIKAEAARAEASRIAAKAESIKAEAAKVEPFSAKFDPVKVTVAPAKVESSITTVPAKVESSKIESAKVESGKISAGLTTNSSSSGSDTLSANYASANAASYVSSSSPALDILRSAHPSQPVVAEKVEKTEKLDKVETKTPSVTAVSAGSSNTAKISVSTAAKTAPINVAAASPPAVVSSAKSESRVASSDVVSRPIRDKWALIVGISKFRDPSISELRYSAKDAADFYKYLINEAGFAPDHVRLLLDDKADQRRVMSELGSKFLARVAKPDDLVVLYFSTHGSPSSLDIRGKNYLVAHDSDPNDLFATGIEMQKIVESIQGRVLTDRVLLVLDACHSGIAGDSAKSVGRVANFDAADIAQGSGQIVICSSDQNEQSWESTRYENGVFTRSLLKGLRSHGPKTTLNDAYSATRKAVSDEVREDRAGSRQTPVLKGKWGGNDLIVAVPSQAPQAVPLAVSRELEPDSSPMVASVIRKSKTEIASSIGSTTQYSPTREPVFQNELKLTAEYFKPDGDARDLLHETTEALKSTSRNPSELLFMRAQAEMALQEWTNATADLNSAMQTSPNTAKFYLARAYVYHKIGRAVMAREDLDQARFYDPRLASKITFE